MKSIITMHGNALLEEGSRKWFNPKLFKIVDHMLSGEDRQLSLAYVIDELLYPCFTIEYSDFHFMHFFDMLVKFNSPYKIPSSVLLAAVATFVFPDVADGVTETYKLRQSCEKVLNKPIYIPCNTIVPYVVLSGEKVDTLHDLAWSILY